MKLVIQVANAQPQTADFAQMMIGKKAAPSPKKARL